MQRKDLALRVLSTAAIMSIVTSIAAPAFAGTYYIGKGSIDVVTSTDGNVHVIQNRIAYIDRDNEIVIKDGTSEADTTLKDANRAAATPAADPAATHATQELEAAGSADAAGESQPDPDAAFTLSEAELIQKELDLSEAEFNSIVHFERGCGLISTNSNNLVVEFKASQLEKDLITTDRKDLQKLKGRIQKYGESAYGNTE